MNQEVEENVERIDAPRARESPIVLWPVRNEHRYSNNDGSCRIYRENRVLPGIEALHVIPSQKSISEYYTLDIRNDRCLTIIFFFTIFD